LVDNWARSPMKVVPSCDTTWGRRMDALDPKIAEWDIPGFMPIPLEQLPFGNRDRGRGTRGIEAS